MQLILVQTEIEQALKDYISARLTIGDGQNILIDLAATRGADGFKATIDIVDGEPQAVKAPVKAVEADPVKPATTTQGKVPKASAPVKAEAAGTAQTVADAKSDLEGVITDSGDGEAATPADAEPEKEADAPAPTERKSLFGGLKSNPMNAEK